MELTQLNREIEYLSTFMGEHRYSVLSSVVKERTNHMTVCVENIAHFRPNVKIVKGSDKWIDIKRYGRETTTVDMINSLRSKGYKIVAATPHENDFTPTTLDVSEPFALFFGTEKQGISKELEDNTDSFIQVPMYGFVESLNVSVCAAIMIQTLMERVRQSGVDWRLPSDDQTILLHRWMRYSVKDSENILRKFREKNV